MKFTQVRNATVIVEFAGKRFLVDPLLGDKDAYPGFDFSVNSHLTWPTVELPFPVADILDVDAIILTHYHPDHWDAAATRLVPKDKLIYSQSQKDAGVLAEAGFTNVKVLADQTKVGEILLTKVPGRHGVEELFEGPFAEPIGDVCGIVFAHPSEKTLYLAGDTVWYEAVKDNIDAYRPDVIVLNSCDARMIEPTLGETSIIMGKEDVYQVSRAAPSAAIIASHMGAVNHACLTRSELRSFAQDRGFASQLLIPADGEELQF